MALIAWSCYVLSVLPSFPDVTISTFVAGFFGIVACLAVIFNFNYWRAAILLTSAFYLLLYAIRVIRMVGMTTEISFLSALSFYYSASWQVAAAMFQEKGMAGGIAHAFLEYAMPVLIGALIAVTLISQRPQHS